MTEKDYSLLRPFDLEAAKAGAKVCWHEDGEVAVDVMFVRDRVIPLFEMCFSEDHAAVFTHDDSRRYLRAAPLCWVEGKPVYPGDVLERENWKAFIPDMVAISGELRMLGEGLPSYLKPEQLHWPRPKPVKRWVNIYPAYSFESQDSANEYATSSRIACIEIELPPIKP